MTCPYYKDLGFPLLQSKTPASTASSGLVLSAPGQDRGRRRGESDMCVALAGQDAESNGEGEADDKLLTWGA